MTSPGLDRLAANPLDLSGTVIAVTGATRGIGRATAELLASHGACIAAIGSESETAALLADNLQTQFGIESVGIGADSRHPMRIQRAYQTIFRQFGRLDVLVNNAGVLRDALIGMVTDELLRETFDVNTLGAIHHLQGAARLMSRTGNGSIVNLTSIVGVQGNDGQIAYSSSKAALVGLTKSAAKELAPLGIRVNAIAPGFIDTDMSRSLPEDKFLERTESIRMNRLGSPDDVANAVLFFASRLSSYVTGQVLGVDGGMRI